MATLEEMADKLREVNPANAPMHLPFIAKTLWPDAPWLMTKSHHHNGGARRGAKVAAGTMGRMQARGLAKRWIDPDGACLLSQWVMVKPDNLQKD